MSEPYKFDSLNTAFVSLAALIRYLREQKFVGRIHAVLDQYENDVFLYGSDEPSVWEINRATGKEEQGHPAMQRLLVRSREPGGVITIYEGAAAARPSTETSAADQVEIPEQVESEGQPDLSRVIALGGELIGAVERVVESTGIGFNERFHNARIEIGDDYPFIDPTVGGFDYSQSKIIIQTTPSRSVLVKAVTESLKRVVTRVAEQNDENGFRERVAVELAVTARKLPGGFEDFTAQLDSIAGTRVL